MLYTVRTSYYHSYIDIYACTHTHDIYKLKNIYFYLKSNTSICIKIITKYEPKILKYLFRNFEFILCL